VQIAFVPFVVKLKMSLTDLFYTFNVLLKSLNKFILKISGFYWSQNKKSAQSAKSARP